MPCAGCHRSSRGGDLQEKAGGLHTSAIKAIANGRLENSDELLDTIATCVCQASEEWNIVINSSAFQNLLAHIVVALIRISEDCYVPIEDSRLQRIVETYEFRAAEDIATRIATLTGVTLPREEIAYIAIHLAGKQTIYHSPDEDSLVISDEVWEVVSDMLERVRRVFRFDFRNDLELRMNLARHIQPLSVRLRYKLKLTNPMLEDIKARYPLSFSIAADASSVIAEKYGASLSHDEIGYIALAFELALERSKTEVAKKNILVICASGGGKRSPARIPVSSGVWGLHRPDSDLRCLELGQGRLFQDRLCVHYRSAPYRAARSGSRGLLLPRLRRGGEDPGNVPQGDARGER